jgi:hypothetical protein
MMSNTQAQYSTYCSLKDAIPTLRTECLGQRIKIMADSLEYPYFDPDDDGDGYDDIDNDEETEDEIFLAVFGMSFEEVEDIGEDAECALGFLRGIRHNNPWMDWGHDNVESFKEALLSPGNPFWNWGAELG